MWQTYTRRLVLCLIACCSAQLVLAQTPSVAPHVRIEATTLSDTGLRIPVNQAVRLTDKDSLGLIRIRRNNGDTVLQLHTGKRWKDAGEDDEEENENDSRHANLFPDLPTGEIVRSNHYNGFPTLIQNKGRSHVFFARLAYHTDTSGFLNHTWFDGSGTAFTTPMAVLPSPIGFAAGVSKTGRLIVLTSYTSSFFARIAYSDNNGDSFLTAPSTAPRPHYGSAPAGMAVLFGEIKTTHTGRLIANYYRGDSGHEAAGLVGSDDNGLTWNWVGEVDNVDNPGGAAINEVSFLEVEYAPGQYVLHALARPLEPLTAQRHYYSLDDGATWTYLETLDQFQPEVYGTPVDMQLWRNEIWVAKGFRNAGGRIKYFRVAAKQPPTTLWNTARLFTVGKAYAHTKQAGFYDFGYASIKPTGTTQRDRMYAVYYDHDGKSPNAPWYLAIHCMELTNQKYAFVNHPAVSVPSAGSYTYVYTGFTQSSGTASSTVDGAGFLHGSDTTSLTIPEDGLYQITVNSYGQTGAATDRRTIGLFAGDPGMEYTNTFKPMRSLNASSSFSMNSNPDFSVMTTTGMGFMKKGELVSIGLLQTTGSAVNWAFNVSVAKIGG